MDQNTFNFEEMGIDMFPTKKKKIDFSGEDDSFEESFVEEVSVTPRRIKPDIPAKLRKTLVNDLEEVERSTPKTKLTAPLKKRAEKALYDRKKDEEVPKIPLRELKVLLRPYEQMFNLSYQKIVPLETEDLKEYLVYGMNESSRIFDLRCSLTFKISERLPELGLMDCVVLGHILINKTFYGITYSDEIEEVIRGLLN